MSRSLRTAARALRAVARPQPVAIPFSRPMLNTGAGPSRVSQRLSMSRGYASSSTPISSTDPTLDRANELIDLGTRELEEGDVSSAKALYKQSVEVKETSGGWFNLGVCEYHLKNNSAAIEAWEKSIALSPSADAYTNIASAYVLAQPPQPALAIQYLTSALELTPEDPEIAFNLAAVLESTDNLDTALKMYERAQRGGIDRAGQNIRNVGAKILAKKVKETAP